MQEQNHLQNILYNLGYEINKDGNIENKLNFSGYKINNYFTSQIKDWKQQVENKEDILKEIDNFLSFYFDGGDFGYFKNKYDNYSYRLEYSGEDTSFIWSSKDSFYIKTSDENNNFKPDLGSLFGEDTEFIFEKKFDEDKPKNHIEIIKKDEETQENEETTKQVYFVNIYNQSLKNAGKGTKEEETKKYLLSNIEKSLNEHFDDRNKQIGTEFIKQFSKNGELEDFFTKWKKDYFIHKNIKQFLENELLNYLWDKYGNANIAGYNDTLKQIEKEKFDDFFEFLNNEENKINQENKEKLFDEIDNFLQAKLYKKDDILAQIKKLADKNGENKIIDILQENQILNNIITKQKESFDDVEKTTSNEFWEEFRKQTKTLIDIIAQIEEIKKSIWTSKRNVEKSDYVITLDKIFDKKQDKDFLLNLINEEQITEWKDDLKMIDENFDKNNIFEENDLKKEYKYLPLDTKYLDNKDRYKLLSLFENLEEELNGLLIKSENYQALNTILNKYEGKVQTTYIDPPFNLGENGDFLYKTDYGNGSWTSMLYDRINLGKKLLSNDGSFWIRCDYNGNYLVRQLNDLIFGKGKFMNEIIINRFKKNSNAFTNSSESLFLYIKNDNFIFNKIYKNRQCSFCKQNIEPKWGRFTSSGQGGGLYFTIKDKKVLLYPPKGRHWTNKQQVLEKLEKEGRIKINEKLSYTDINGKKINFLPEKLQSDNQDMDNNWTDISGYDFGAIFSTQNSEILLKRVIESGSNENDIVLDFFMGSATTQSVAHKLGRKYIGIELGNQFYEFDIPRLKNTLFGQQKGISKEKDVNYKGGGAFKYIELQNYENIFDNSTIEDYISKYFEENQNQVDKKDYTNFAEYIENYKFNTIETKEFLQSIVYDFGFTEKSYKAFDDFVILETNKGNFVKFFENADITKLLEHTQDDKKYYLQESDYKNLVAKIDNKEKMKNIFSISKLYFNN